MKTTSGPRRPWRWRNDAWIAQGRTPFGEFPNPSPLISPPRCGDSPNWLPCPLGPFSRAQARALGGGGAMMTGSSMRIPRAVLLPVLLWMGAFRTTEASLNEWTAIGPEGGTVVTLAIDPQAPSTLYAGTRESGVFKSTDGGGSWRAINSGLAYVNGTLTILDLVIDPQSPATLYAGTSPAGVYKSIDGGASWRSANAGLPYLGILDLAIDPQSPATL